MLLGKRFVLYYLLKFFQMRLKCAFWYCSYSFKNGILDFYERFVTKGIYNNKYANYTYNENYVLLHDQIKYQLMITQ